MVFRIKDNLLYEINLDGISDDEFLKKQDGGKVKFVKLSVFDLPKLSKTDKRIYTKIFYKYSAKGNLIIDKARTEKKWIEDKYKELEKYIYTYYPPVKQQSDIADKNYYEIILKNGGITNLDKDIVTRTKNYFENGRKLDDVVSDIADENKKEAYLQLIKTAIRVTWVIDCKKELKQAINEKREPEYPKAYL